MGKQYNAELQAKVEAYMKETGVSQAKLAPMMNLSGAVLSQYRRSVYDKGDVEDVERKIREFFQIKEEQAENIKKAESFSAARTYADITVSESIYKMIRYRCSETIQQKAEGTFTETRRRDQRPAEENLGFDVRTEETR